VLPLLDAGEVSRAAKPFIGYSDLTAVLTFCTVYCGVAAFHGPMLAGRLSRGAGGYDATTLLNALTRTEPMGRITVPGVEAIRPGEARGPLFGGTLTQLLASFGTPFAFEPPRGCVLFLEEVAERPYRLDRMVTQLKQSGTLSRAAAIVIGELPNCDEPGGDPTARAVMADLFADFPGPVIIGLPSGHTTSPALTLPLGIDCRVVTEGEPALVVEESAVV
jgi:muramoyltetrapeptide carboxypeptidase